VTIVVDGKAISRVLRVERVNGSPGATVAVFDDDEDP
jgi:hypothetical protein